MKTNSNLIVAMWTLALTVLVLGVVPAAFGLYAVAGDIPPDLTPVSYLPYIPVYRTPTPTPSPEGPTPAVYLPYIPVYRTPTPTPTRTPTPTPAPGPVGLKVYDMNGVQRTYQWAVNKYGVRVEPRSGWGYHCVELREITGPSSLEVWVYQANGLPAANVRVEFYWPSGMDYRYTEASGKAGFGYGSGSWIWDPTVGGAHWLVVNSASTCDAVSRLGMLAMTNHDHLNVSYRYGYLSAAP
jgi:hypothetical protein